MRQSIRYLSESKVTSLKNPLIESESSHFNHLRRGVEKMGSKAGFLSISAKKRTFLSIFSNFYSFFSDYLRV